MRNVMLSLALVFLGCSSGSGAAVLGDDAGTPRRGLVSSGGEQAQPGQDAQPRAGQDALALDSVVVAADALPAQPDTLAVPVDTTPTPPPVAWEPGPETTDPALMVCPPIKGNSLGIGKACSRDVGGARCPQGLSCACGGEIGPTSTPMFTKTMPCMCTAATVGGPNGTFDCPPCGEGAGCCNLRNSINSLWACMLNACAGAYCRPYTAGAR